MRNILIFFFACSISSSLFAQRTTLNFDVIHNDSSLGTLVAYKTVEGKEVTYESHTEIAYHLLATINITYDYKVVFKDNILESSYVHVVVKGHDKTKAKTVKYGDKYSFYLDGEFQKGISGLINYSIEKLLFEEPIGVSKVYAESFGEYHKLQKVGTGKYVKTATNGHKNLYIYKNGELQRSDVDAGVIEFSIVRRK